MAKQDYSAADIRVLEGLEPVRKRPGMYIGSTDATGLHHLVKEIVDNSVDEAIVGYAKEISVFLTADGYATVVDNGRGIPTDMHPSGVSALEIAMTKLHAGGKFDEMAYQASGGLHGVGASAVNALSTDMRVVVKRNKKYYFQEYTIGTPREPVKEISEKKVLEYFPLQAKTFISYESGTLSNFQPDASIFSTVVFNVSTIKDFLRERAYLMAGLYFKLFDEGKQTEQHFYFEGGIRSLVAHLNHTKKPLHPVVSMEGEYDATKFKVFADIALQFNDSYSETIESFANTIKTPDGGTHLTGFRTALNKSLKDYVVRNQLVKNEKDMFTSEDLREGMTAVIFVKMPSNDIQFESQTKTKLNNAEVQSAVYQIVKTGLDQYFEEHPKEARTIVDKVMLAARARMAARAAKEAVIRKGVFEGSSLPGKLADCQSSDAAECELYMVEGDSAGGCFAGDTKVALVDGRNLSFQEIVAEQQAGKTHFCYTIRKNGQIGVEQFINARITKKNAKVIKLQLDNGEQITCTPDHLFMTRSGEYKRADQLLVSDSLMPLYRKHSSTAEKGITIDGYEMAWDPKSDTWLFTHLLSDWYNRWKRNYTKDSGAHCHHVDFNKLNNNPDNLLRMTKELHLALHTKQVHKTLHRPEVIEKSRRIHQSMQYRATMSNRMKQPATSQLLSVNAKKQWSDTNYKEFMADAWKRFYSTNLSYQEAVKSRLTSESIKYWSSSEHRQTQAERVATYFQSHVGLKKEYADRAKKQWENTTLLQWRKQKTAEQWTEAFRTIRKNALDKTYYLKTLKALKDIQLGLGEINLSVYQAKREETKDRSLLRFDRFCERYFNGEQARALDAVTHFNHRITKIESVTERMDVYDAEVPSTHNFALASGVFVHNSAKQGRDRKFQAIFPLRGKILNTERARLDKIVDFEELKNLVIALGTGLGDTFDIKKLRYHRIILMNDADVDGEHITTLGLTFFYRHLPQLVAEGYLYIAMPPLFKIWNKKDVRYAFTEEERDVAIAELKSGNLNVNVQRYKGLGEMNPEQLWETTMNPATRMLKQITLEDAAKVDVVFTTLMGDEVPPRKKFIQTHAKLANLDI